MLDEAVSFEAQNYSVRRPVSISSWPTLDPLTHPTEIYTDEDKASFDIDKINRKKFRGRPIRHLSCLFILSQFYQSAALISVIQRCRRPEQLPGLYYRSEKSLFRYSTDNR